MATASAYDQWFEGGLSFTDEEVAGYRPEAFATRRIDLILDELRVLHRADELSVAMEALWKDVRKQLFASATWYARALVVPGIDMDAFNASFPAPDTPAGKALTVRAHEEVRAEWIHQYLQSRMKDMTYVVTIGRQCVERRSLSGWGKSDASLSNKLANAVHKEVTLGERWSKQLESITSRNSEVAQ